MKPIDTQDLYDELHPDDRALLERAEVVAAECHNAADHIEGKGTRGAGLMALCTSIVFTGGVLARGMRELTEAIKAAEPACISNCQCLRHACQPAANDAGQVAPGAGSELD